jgi:DNA polymerase I-like protein with 3'-5' exonuclease and polymerase domains
MAMMLRGVRVDLRRRDEGVKELEAKFAELTAKLNTMTAPWWAEIEKETGPCPTPKRKDGKHSWPRLTSEPLRQDSLGNIPAPMLCTMCGSPRMRRKPFNPLSNQQAKRLLYEAMGLEEQYDKKGKVSVDKDCLSRLANRYPEREELVLMLREAKMTAKLASTLRSAVSPDGRMRSSFNVAAADTDRWSSSKNPKREGMNLQNVPESLRDMFVADSGQWLVYADLEQAESRIVAYMSGDEGFIAAHGPGKDVHTEVCKQHFPDLPWTGDSVKDKAIAEQPDPNDPGHTLRFNSKRVRHGRNYRLTPYGVARLLKQPRKIVEPICEAGDRAYPGILAWQQVCEDAVRGGRPLVSPLGRRRYFYGRSWDKHTFRQAIAHGPQNLCVTVLDIGLWHVWWELDRPEMTAVELTNAPEGALTVIPGLVRHSLLAQVHDAILGEQAGEPGEPAFEATLSRIKKLMELAVDITDIGGVTRRMTIPVEIMIGRNWGKHSTDPAKGRLNPEGMRKWTPA